MPEWEWRKQGNIQYITLPNWEKKGVRVSITCRYGGFSQGEFSSLNLAFHVGDNQPTVLKNRKLWAESLGIDLADIVCARQVHSSNVRVVDESDRGKGVFDYFTGLPDTDGMVTGKPGVYLVTFYADCIPVLFFDVKRKVVGVAHSGWKGTMAGIAARTVECMAGAFNCDLSDIIAFIGPGIGGCCYEVDNDLARRVMERFGPDVNLVLPGNEGRLYWDLPRTNRVILERAGLLPGNVAVCELCTACNQDVFYSYRGSRGKTGRMGVLLGLD